LKTAVLSLYCSAYSVVICTPTRSLPTSEQHGPALLHKDDSRMPIAGPVCWNTLPDYLKSSDLSFNCFRQQLQTF